MTTPPPSAPPHPKLPDPFQSLGELVEQLADQHPGDPAFRAGALAFSRGELAARTRTLASGWRAEARAPGEVIGLVGESGSALALALLSTARAGLVPLLLDPRLTREEADAVCERARPKAIALCGEIPEPWPLGLPTHRIGADGSGGPGPPGDAPPVGSDPHAPAVLLVTSGTSGRTGVVALSAHNLSANIRAGAEAHPCDRGDVFLSLLPMTHAFELTTGFLGPLACGAAVVFPGSRNPNRLLGAVASEGVNRVNVVPAILAMMLGEIRDAEGGRDILMSLRGRLRSITCGGAPIAPEMAETVVKSRLPLWLGYGLTEASPIVALGRADSLPRGSTGRPLPGVEVRVAEPTGEVLVRGPNVMCGYVGDEAATRAAIRDGWLHTGDVGRLDQHGNLYILGRLRDLIVTGAGLKLAPEHVEAAYRSPLFSEVCAIGVADPGGGGGERPHLVVVPAPDALADDAALRAEFARLSAAAGDRRAHGLTVLDSPLPRTRTLKLRRDLVRKAVLEKAGAEP